MRWNNFEERFKSNINIKDENSCWNWLGCTRQNYGYGVFQHNYVKLPASYYSLLIFCGIDIPSGMRVFNICGNALCVNPNHLEIADCVGRPNKNYPKVRNNKSLYERFLLKFDESKVGECWEWAASLDGRGYGQIKNGKSMSRAHRISWEYYNSQIPEGMHVLHRCDNPVCVNPHHLFLGTHQDNMRDMARKGRSTKGRHWRINV